MEQTTFDCLLREWYGFVQSAEVKPGLMVPSLSASTACAAFPRLLFQACGILPDSTVQRSQCDSAMNDTVEI